MTAHMDSDSITLNRIIDKKLFCKRCRFLSDAEISMMDAGMTDMSIINRLLYLL